MESLRNRRSVRSYSPKSIEEPLLSEMIELAMRASTTGNMQLYSLIVTTSEEDKKALAPFHFNQPCVVQAPVLLTVCADFNRFSKWCEYRDAVPGYANFHSFTTAMIDALLFAQTFSIVAEERGLGICFLGTVTYNAQAFVDYFELPRLVVPVAALTVGYPSATPFQPDRLPVEAVIHNGKYHDYTRENIDTLYRLKEGLEENKRFVAENNKDTLAQVFTDIRYKKSDNELVSKSYLEVIRRQGFMD